MIQAEFHRPIPIDRVGPRGLDVTVEATAAECAALAERMNLPALRALTCVFHLSREGQTRVLAEGHLRADVVQTCVITMEDFDASLEEVFRVRFVPAGEEREEIDLEEDDEVPFEGATLDLGEAAAEQLGLALDPYPRAPGAELPEIDEDAEAHPFGALGNLKRLN